MKREPLPFPRDCPGPSRSPVSGSPGSRLISMSKWHCGRSCAPIATEAAARARRKWEESLQGGSLGEGWGGARATVASRRPVSIPLEAETGSPPAPGLPTPKYRAHICGRALHLVSLQPEQFPVSRRESAATAAAGAQRH